VTEEPEPASAQPPMRASHADRERVAAALQHAMSEGRLTVAELEGRLDSVYAAKTIAELEPLTRDLPGSALSLSKSAQPVAPRAASEAQWVHSAGGPAKANLVGIMSGVVRKGPWVVPEHINCVAIMGGIELNFTEAQLTSRETVMNVTAIMGGVEITVPEGITVICEGIGIMGAFEDSSRQVYGPEAPVLRLKGLALMGGVEVRGRKRALGA
jgi:hypothetical protein